MSWSTFCSVTTSFLYRSDVGPKYSASNISNAAVSFVFSLKAGPRNATLTYGGVSVGHGTWAWNGPAGFVSWGMAGGAAVPAFHPPQAFSTAAIVASGVTSPATMMVVNSGRYHRSKNVFE